MSKYYFFFVCWSCFFISCSSDSPLEQALSKSGKNRMQLEQVLKHYSLHPADSLKYRAACYLIANMPGHGWYEGEALDVYKQWIDSVYCGQSFVFKATLYEAFFQQPGATEGLVRYEDIEQLDSNFLITYIDSAFRAIRKRPWLKNLQFGQLCEYVLPYRVGHERPQQLFRLQDSIFHTDIADLLNYDDIGNEVATGIGLSQIFNGRIPREAKVLYRGTLINYNLTGCVGQAMLRSWLARLTLCPVALDLNPAFPTRNDRHCWSVMIDNRQMNSIQRLAFEVNKQGKIYRQTFTRNPAPDTGKSEYIPPFFRSPFYRDVTSCYTRVKDVPVTPLKPVSVTYGYLGVFNDLKWEPVAYAGLREGRFLFKDVGCGIVYLPLIYPDGDAVAVSYPFLLDLTGKVQLLQPDTTHLLTLKLKRKYPSRLMLRSANRRFLNSVVEASNDPSFRRKDSIGVFKYISELQWAEIKTGSSQSYRYWRICSRRPFYVGECILYNAKGESIKPLQNVPGFTASSPAFDVNPISYAFSDRNYILQWDMGKKVSLSGIECLLRYDGNSVYPGHWYELNYHDGSGWCSLGVKEATERWVEFSEIPANALLWLRDLTTGKEERIFTYTDGKICFW